MSLLASRFIQRRDLKAKQLPSGAYNPVRNRFTQRDLRLHLSGNVTLGHYVVDRDDKCRVLAFDLDFDKAFEWHGQSLNPRDVFAQDHPAKPDLNKEIRQLADGLAVRLKRMYPGLIVMTSFSGSKGIHVYGSFPIPTRASAAREMAMSVLDFFGCFSLVPDKGKNFYKHNEIAQAITIEIYPKQESVGSGVGNLLRLPLGVHQRTGRRGFFYDPFSDITELAPVDPVAALRDGVIH